MFVILQNLHFQTSVCIREGDDCGFCAAEVVEAGITIEGTSEIVNGRELFPLTSVSPNENWKAPLSGWFLCCRAEGAT